SAFLDRRCGSNDSLRNAVRLLLKANAEASGLFLTVPAGETPFASDQAAASWRLEIGDRLADRYRIEARLGRGGMGEVYRAADLRLGRTVAVKTLRHGCTRSPEVQDRFDRELRSVAALTHPNVVAVYDVITAQDATYAVMEYVPGRTLREFAVEGLPWTRVAGLATDMLRGLAAAHDIGLMHRDVKPDNVIVLESGTAKLLDFGLARPEEVECGQEITVADVAAGTVPYMSPEQARGDRLTCATDVFSTATVLYELLTGRNPFRAPTAFGTARNITDGPVPNLSAESRDIPESLAALIARMHSLRPDQRPAAAEAIQELEQALAGSDDTVFTPIASLRLSRSDWNPTLEIAPFHVHSDDVELRESADLIAGYLATVLTRVPLLTVPELRRKTSGEAEPDFSFTGTLRRTPTGVRAAVRLADARRTGPIWAQQLDCGSGPDLVDELSLRLLCRLEARVVAAVADRAGTDTPRGLLLRAISILSVKGWHRESFAEAGSLLAQAVDAAPELALARAYYGFVRALEGRFDDSADAAAVRIEAATHAEAALDLADFDSNVVGLVGCINSELGRTDRAIPLLRHAIDLDPTNAQAHAGLGATLLLIGEIDEAVEHLETGVRLSPLDARLAAWQSVLSLAHLRRNDLDAALAAADAATIADRRTHLPWLMLALIRTLRGEADRAAAAWAECRRANPHLSSQQIAGFVGPTLASQIQDLAHEETSY
ncbi:MAG: protein kinase, partial [Planctomycetota bacterium]